MYQFLRMQQEENRIELEIDLSIFSKDLVMKAAFQYLDQAYFFFKRGEMNSLIVQCQAKEDVKLEAEFFLKEFSDTLLEVTLRDTLEKENRVIRETIISRALL